MYIYIYGGRLKSLYDDNDTLIECDQLRFIFQQSPTCGTHFFHWCCNAWIPLIKSRHHL